MKKLFLTILSVLILPVFLYAATINVTAPSEKDVNRNGTKIQCTYTITDSVTTGTTQVFRLNVPFSYGDIITVAHNSSSDNCTIGIFETEALANAWSLPVLELNNDDGFYSPEIWPRPYANKEAKPNQYKLYMAVRATGTATDNQTLILTLEQN